MRRRSGVRLKNLLVFRGRSPPAISGTLGCIQATFPRPPGPHPRTVFIEQKPKLNPARERRNRNRGVQHTGHGKRKSGRRAVGRRVWRRPVARHRGAPRREPARRASERCSIFSEAPWEGAQPIRTDYAVMASAIVMAQKRPTKVGRDGDKRELPK